MRRPLILAGLLVLGAPSVLAQPPGMGQSRGMKQGMGGMGQGMGMGQGEDMTVRPLMVTELPKGTVTVRVGRGSLGNVVTGLEIKATLTAPDGKVSERSERTQADGRATFSNLPVGSQFRARAEVDGQILQTATFPIPAEGGARLMLISTGAPREPEPDEKPAPAMPPAMPPPASGGARDNPHAAGHGHESMRPETVIVLPSKVQPQKELPPGTLELHLLDAQGAPVTHQEVQLGHMAAKPEEGVSWVTAVSDDKGLAKFQKLDTAGDPSYVALFEREGLRLGSTSIRLPKDSGIAGELRIPGRTKDVAVLKVSEESRILVDLREDKLEVMENLVLDNTSDAIFQSDHGGLAIPLPAEASNAEPIAGGSPLDNGPKGGLFLRQSIAPSVPGQMPAQARFGFFVPIAGEERVTLRQPMPWGMEGPVLMIPASLGLTPNAPGMKALPPQDDDHGGQMLLFQLAAVPRNGVLTFSLSGLPSRPVLGKTLAGVLAAALFMGALLGVRRPKAASKTTQKRESLLGELVDVERQRQKAAAPDAQLDDKRASLLSDLIALDDHGR